MTDDRTTRIIKKWLDSPAGREQIQRSADEALATLEQETGEPRDLIIRRFLSQ